MIADLIASLKLAKDLADNGGDASSGFLSRLMQFITGGESRGMRKAARESTLFFPVIMTSNSATPENATLIMKVIEHNNLAMLQLAIANNDIVDLDENSSKLSFMKLLHSNIELGNTWLLNYREDTVIDTMTFTEMCGGPYDVLAFAASDDPNDPIVKLYTEAISEYDVRAANVTQIRQQIDNIDSARQRLVDQLATIQQRLDMYVRTNPQLPALSKDQQERVKELEGTAARYRTQLKELDAEREKLVELLNKAGEEQKKASTVDGKSVADANTMTRIDTGDITKLGGLTPSVLTAEIVYRHPSTGMPEKSTVTFGVKCVPHLVNSTDAVSYLGETYKTGNPVFQTIRWISGELRLVRDVLLQVDRAKFEARASRNNESVWGRLRAYTQMSRVRSILAIFLREARRNPIIPNASLVVSRDDVEMMKMKHRVNMYDADVASKICEKLGFVEIFIVEEDGDGKASATVYDRERATFERYTHDLLRKNSQTGKLDARELVSLIKR